MKIVKSFEKQDFRGKGRDFHGKNPLFKLARKMEI